VSRSWRRAGTALAFALGAPAWARAQDTTTAVAATTVAATDRVRLRVATRDTRGRAIQCEARVSTWQADTLVLTNTSRWAGCPSLVYPPGGVTSLEVAHGSRGSRAVHTVVGLLVGAAAGGTVGRLFAGAATDCVNSSCDDGGLAEFVFTFAGIALGGGIGGVAGLALPAGPRWVTVPTGGPVRVAGLQLQPALRVRTGGQ